jgi:hypothetical protein
MMPERADEIVGALGRELVSDLAPEELPLYPSLLSQFQGAKRSRGGKKSSDDQFLGFGAAEALTMLTPVILAFTSNVWQALVAEAAQSAAHGIVEYVRSHLPGHHQTVAPPLTADQLQLVRTVAEREARQLDISEGQAGLLADAMIGILAGPQA